MTAVWITLVLAILCGALMYMERNGFSTTLTLTFKSDLKRETRFIAQYGQFVCTIFVSLLILQLDKTRGWAVLKAMLGAWIVASVIGTVIKRLVGRTRPRSEHGGKFLGPALKHANFRESFPSSHSAAAFAMSTVLAHAYPQAAITFWILAILCATLRYFMDAHWPSDVLGGIALGFILGAVACSVFL